MHNADALTALFNPTVNSYKRIDAQVTLSGATWSPNAITYGGNNRTHMVRVPEAGRFEMRLMDGAANPYLLQAGVLMAGLDGVANKRDPGKPLDINMYTEGQNLRGLRRLPSNLLDAIRVFEKSRQLRQIEALRLAPLFGCDQSVGARAHAGLLNGPSVPLRWQIFMSGTS